MKFTVLWTASTEQELARLWTDAIDRSLIADSADEIDEALKRDPLSFGESRGGVTRIAHVAPLGVLFDVFEPDQRVMVWNVWRWE